MEIQRKAMAWIILWCFGVDGVKVFRFGKEGGVSEGKWLRFLRFG